MQSAAADVSPPWPEPSRRSDHVVALRDVPWAIYEALCEAREQSAGPRLAYLDGLLEIMSPSRAHEHWKTLIARIVEAFAEERDISLNGFGSETFRLQARRAGVEPDECYCIGRARKLPDFVIEVVHTSGDVDKLEIYRRLRIPEVWFWLGSERRFYVYRLQRGRYRLRERSAALPGLDLAELAAIVAATDESKQTEAVRSYRARLRKRG